MRGFEDVDRISRMHVVACAQEISFGGEARVVMDRKVVSPPIGEGLSLARHPGRGGMFMKFRL